MGELIAAGEKFFTDNGAVQSAQNLFAQMGFKKGCVSGHAFDCCCKDAIVVGCWSREICGLMSCARVGTVSWGLLPHSTHVPELAPIGKAGLEIQLCGMYIEFVLLRCFALIRTRHY